jgi:hypothetical protein
MIDFAGLKDLVKPDHLKVLELSPGLSPEEARRGAGHIKAVWGPE